VACGRLWPIRPGLRLPFGPVPGTLAEQSSARMPAHRGGPYAGGSRRSATLPGEFADPPRRFRVRRPGGAAVGTRGEFVMTAAEVLDEGVAGGDSGGRPEAFERGQVSEATKAARI
jgi:hypothetical protein